MYVEQRIHIIDLKEIKTQNFLFLRISSLKVYLQIYCHLVRAGNNLVCNWRL